MIHFLIFFTNRMYSRFAKLKSSLILLLIAVITPISILYGEQVNVKGISHDYIVWLALIVGVFSILIIHLFIFNARRKEARNALFQETDELYRFFNLTPDLLCIIDTDGCFRRVNQEWQNLLGFTKEELIGECFFKFVYPEDIKNTEKAMKKLLAEGNVFNFVNRYQHKNGSYIWIEWHSLKQGDRIYGVARNITERKKFEQMQLESENRLRALIENAPFGAHEYKLDSQNNLLFVGYNQVANRILSVDCEQFIGKTIGEAFPPLAKTHVPDAYRNVALSGERYEDEQVTYSYGQIEGAYEIFAYQTLHRRMAVFFRDITERKRDEEKLIRLNRELQAISGCNQALIRAEDELQLFNTICKIITDVAGYKMVWVGLIENDKVQSVRVVAYSGVEKGYLPNKYYFPADESLQNPAGIVISSKQFCIINDIRSISDTIVWRNEALKQGLNSVVALPLIGGNGDPFGVINIYAVSRNAFIKDEVKLMAELAGDMSYGIEGLRSRKERLIAEQNLEKTLKEKEALIQELYHRTKNNMQIISAFLGMQAHLARDEILARPFREMESRIRAMALVHEKLYKSKNLSQINLKEYIPELVNLLLNGYPNLSGKLEFDIDIDEIFVTIDIAIPCGLVITELLTNSFKYAFPGDRAGLITIRLRKENESFINLNISDNGVGSNEIVDITTIDSLGIPMIATIIENQLHGTVALDTLNGFKWNIRLRYDLYKERV